MENVPTVSMERSRGAALWPEALGHPDKEDVSSISLGHGPDSGPDYEQEDTFRSK